MKKNSIFILAILAILGFVVSLIFVVLNLLQLKDAKKPSLGLNILTMAKLNAAALGFNTSFITPETAEVETIELSDVSIRNTSENYYLSSGQNKIALAQLPYTNYEVKILKNDDLLSKSEYSLFENVITLNQPVSAIEKFTVQYSYLLNLQ